MDAVWDWWLSLWPDHGLIGPLIALVVAAFAVLVAGNVVVWTLAGLKALGRGIVVGFREQWSSKSRKRNRRANAELVAALAELPDMWQRSAADARLAVEAHLDSLESEAEDPHQELGVVDERPVDHR